MMIPENAEQVTHKIKEFVETIPESMSALVGKHTIAVTFPNGKEFHIDITET